MYKIVPQTTVTDERNFRSSYYEKVGCYSVEEKKSLNKLLQDNIRSQEKLKKFCLSYTVPSAQRRLLWNIILGILPLHKASTQYILEQRKQTYDDLLKSATVMQYVDSTTPKSTVLHTLWLLENNCLLATSAREDYFTEIVKVLLQIFENDMETYWIAKEFYLCTLQIQNECPALKELTQNLLKREDIAMHNLLEKLDIFSCRSNILDRWFSTGFANVIGDYSLVKIWDKICGGSRKIVIFTFLELIRTFRESVLECTTLNDLKRTIEMVKDQDAAIVNNVIKAWQSNKNHSEITVH